MIRESSAGVRLVTGTVQLSGYQVPVTVTLGFRPSLVFMSGGRTNMDMLTADGEIWVETDSSYAVKIVLTDDGFTAQNYHKNLSRELPFAALG